MLFAPWEPGLQVHICQGKTYLNVAYKVTIQRPKVSTLLSSVFLLYATKILVRKQQVLLHLFSFLPGAGETPETPCH